MAQYSRAQWQRTIWFLAIAETLVWAGMYYIFPALLPRWEADLGWSKAQLSAAFTTALVVSAIACYAMSLAPIVWVVISEIFPNRIRGAAMSIAVLSLWVGCTALTFTFPMLNRALGAHGVFWLYGGICVVGFVVVSSKLPETKGKSLEDIERELSRGG